MSDQNNKSVVIIVAVLALLALIGAGAYFSLAGKKAGDTPAQETAATEETPAQPEGPIVTGEVPPQPETPQNVVVETKKLDIPATAEETAAGETPAATTEAAPAAAGSADIEAMMAPRFIGSPDAPIKITEYSSLTCSHCASFHKENYAAFKAKFVDTGKVQLTFKEFPLNPPALDASQILRCMPEDKYVSFMNLLFEQQDNWAYKEEYKDVLRQNAKLAGMSDEQFDACLANEGLKNRIVADMKASSDKYKIQSTPSFVINDGQKTVVGAVPVEAFEKAFEELGSQAGEAPVAPAAPAAQ